ncbi:MAG TPA: CopG family transcriptional regulator [Bacteroidetes bacterium]|nr:CopG family transcriptional regulator [Bacteroidota bacterium]
MKRIGYIGIIIENKDKAENVNRIFSKYGEIIIGRMGIPYEEKNIGIITLIVKGSTDEIGALTGKLGMIEGVSVKSAMSKYYE